MIAPNVTASIPNSPLQAAQTADSAASINSSTNIALDFIGLLTEMIGPIVTLPATEIQESSPEFADAPLKFPTAASGQNEPETAKTSEPKTDQTGATVSLPVMHFVVVTPQNVSEKAVINNEVDREQNTEQPPQPASPAVPPAIVQQTQVEQIWADVKKFEFSIEKAPAHAETENPQTTEAPVQPQKQVIVTTDPLANIQLQQVPPRIMAVEKIVPEMKLAAKGKSGTTIEPTDKPAPASPFHFADVTHSIEQVEQARPTHYVEIPQLPHVPVVRTVAMELGNADSQVMIRVQERGGDVSLQINAPNEALHQDLQSSVGSLIQALKQEQVHVSNIEVSRKTPIDKVRRMKEAN